MVAKKTYVTPDGGSTWVSIASETTDLSGYVAKSGDTMSGNLTSTAKIKDALPQPVTKSSTDGSATNLMSVTAASFANVSTTTQGTMSVSITTPYDVNCILTISGWLTVGPATTGESLRVSTTASGATTWSSGGGAPGGWGNSLYLTGIAANGSGEGFGSTAHVVLSAGTTTITMQAYKTSTAVTTANISFPHISITPISWV
jgi:hypothetical protein